MTTVAFVCVENAGRSQMAAAFARKERTERGIDVYIVTGGTVPADSVHDEVIEAMQDAGIDISDRKPQEISVETIKDADYMVTMSCSADTVCPAGWAIETETWELEDPAGCDRATVSRIRDEIERRVSELFDRLETEL